MSKNHDALSRAAYERELRDPIDAFDLETPEIEREDAKPRLAREQQPAE